MIDMHCHLDLYPNPQSLIKQCIERRLYILSVTTVPSAFEITSSLAPPNSRIRTALGLHPELMVSRARELSLFEKLLPQTKYVGEVGLDGSRDHKSTLEKQQSIFVDILKLCARAGGKTISLHSRGASKIVLDHLEKEPSAGTFILHWFLGSKKQVERAVDLGCWFSINPCMFYSNSGLISVASMPKNRIVPESDGPFASMQGRAALPWDAWNVAEGLSKLWSQSIEDVQVQLTANFRALVALRP